MALAEHAVADFRAAFHRQDRHTLGGGTARRLAGALAQPVATARLAPHLARRMVAFLRRTGVTSRRAYWTGERWRRRVSAKAFAGAVGRKLARAAQGPKEALYDGAPKHPPVVGARPRVLHVIANVAVGGSTRLLTDLMNGLGHRYEMAVLTSAVPAGATYRHMPMDVVPQPGSASAVRAVVERFGPDLIHVHYWGDVDEAWYALAFSAAERLGIPLLQNVNTPVAPFRSPAVRRTVYVSDYVRQTFGGGSDEIVVHPGSDFARFTPPMSEDPHAGDSIGMVYRLERDKLNADSILPLIEVVRRRPRTRAFVIGEGSLFIPFLQRVRDAGVEENFVFPGTVPYAELPAWYARFSVFMAPVWKESFGQVTPFAMAMGRAVVGARVGALPEILGGETWLADTSEAMADKAIQLLDDPALRAEVGAANRARALQHYGLDGMIDGYRALYAELAPTADLLPGLPPAEMFAA